MSEPLRLLLLHGPGDAALASALLAQLAPLVTTGQVQAQALALGPPPPPAALAPALDAADIVVPLLSTDLLGPGQAPLWARVSDLPELHLVPVLARPCAWQSVPVLGPRQPLPRGQGPLSLLDAARAEDALLAIARELAALPRRSRPRPAMPSAPMLLQPPERPYDPAWYVARTALEDDALRLLGRPGQPVVLWGGKGSGKSWLLRHLLERAAAEDGEAARLVLVDLRSLLPVSRDGFYRALAEQLVDAMDRDPEYPSRSMQWVDHAFAQLGTPVRRLKVLVQQHLLPRSPRRLLLGLDGADALVGTPVQDEFYGMLRSWSEVTGSPHFEKLRVLLTVQEDPDALVQTLQQSPFNLTRPLRIGALRDDELAALAARHGLRVEGDDLRRLRAATRGEVLAARRLCHAAAQAGGLAEVLP